MKEQKDFYEKKHHLYRMNSARKRLLLELISDKDREILELGCGHGELAKELKSKGHEIVGVDISENNLSIASEHLSSSYLFDIGGDWPPELISKKFDLVIASEVIEHIFDSDKLLSNIKSVLRDDGSLIITTPNFLFWKNRIRMLLGTFRYEEKGLLDFGHVRFFSVSSLSSLLMQNKFKVTRANHFYPNLYKRGLNFLGRVFPGLLAYQIIVRARSGSR